jgi:hypothetical protein
LENSIISYEGSLSASKEQEYISNLLRRMPLKVLTAGVPKLTELSSVSGIQYGKVPLLLLLFQFSEYISWMHIQYIKKKK